jgi:ABC-2 type transport system permease protein
VFGVELLTFVRAPRELIVATALSAVFLVVANHMMVIWLDSELYVGVYSGDTRAVRTLARHFRDVGLTTVHYRDGVEAQGALDRGALLAYVTITGYAPQRVEVVFAGENPLLDRELAALMLNAASGLSHHTPQDTVMDIRGGRYSASDISLFMVAGLLPFLILLLAGAFCGMRWVIDAERGTLYTFLVTPAPRQVLLVARTAAVGLVALLVLMLSMSVCRPLLTWPLPAAWLPWLGVICLEILACCGIHFAIASFAPTTIVFNAVAYVLGFILLFVSGVLVPVETMPVWERLVARCTPMFYAARAMRDAMIDGRALRPTDLLAMAAWGSACFVVGYLRLRHQPLRAR